MSLLIKSDMIPVSVDCSLSRQYTFNNYKQPKKGLQVRKESLMEDDSRYLRQQPTTCMLITNMIMIVNQKYYATENARQQFLLALKI